jgi:hypothetical protein
MLVGSATADFVRDQRATPAAREAGQPEQHAIGEEHGPT